MIDTGDLGSAPAPIPAPAPAAPVAFRPPLWLSGVTLVMMLAAIGLSSYTLWTRHRDVNPTPIPTPSVNVTEAGKAWAKELPLTFADSFERAQADVRGSGKTLDAIRKEHVERWRQARDAAFNARFESAFDAVIPPGNDKPTMEDRRRYAEVMGAIVTGTREGAK